jgi:hypothetical protein
MSIEFGPKSYEPTVPEKNDLPEIKNRESARQLLENLKQRVNDNKEMDKETKNRLFIEINGLLANILNKNDISNETKESLEKILKEVNSEN